MVDKAKRSKMFPIYVRRGFSFRCSSSEQVTNTLSAWPIYLLANTTSFQAFFTFWSTRAFPKCKYFNLAYVNLTLCLIMSYQFPNQTLRRATTQGRKYQAQLNVEFFFIAYSWAPRAINILPDNHFTVEGGKRRGSSKAKLKLQLDFTAGIFIALL